MKRSKTKLLPIALSTIVLVPILPFITSCASKSTQKPTIKKEEILIEQNKNNELTNIIHEHINNLSLVDQNQLPIIQNELLAILNKSFNKNDIFQNVEIKLSKPTIDDATDFYNATIEINLNPKYVLTINDSNSNFSINDNKLIFKTPIETGIKFYNNQQFIEFQNYGLTNLGSDKIKTIRTYPRNVQTQFYSTDLIEQYEKNYKFVYPGCNRNYEANYDTGDEFYRQKGVDRNLPWTIKVGQWVYDEKVKDNPNKRYNDTGWIDSEIKKNTFKKHPAAKNFFANSTDNIEAVEMSFDISTTIKGPYTLGLFAPAGEPITITFDDETFEKIKNSNWSSQIVINENFWDNYAAPDTGKISDRYPFIESVWDLNKNCKSFSFGTPFGGGISLRINNHLYNSNSQMYFDNSISNIKFTITGAIPCMFYQDGVTTKEDWEKQKELVQQEKLAPIIQANAPFYSFTIPFSGPQKNKIHNTSIEDLVYPRELFQKWNQFLYLSNYYAGKDISNDIRRINIEFCDDIWHNAVAWGGGNNAWCPIDWGVTSFFGGEPIEVFNPKNSWGLLHEVNHNFEQNESLFKRRGHYETNQAIVFDLSVIGDNGRVRSELNYSGDPNNNNDDLGWGRLATPYSAIHDMLKRGNNGDEYTIYALLLYMFGPKRYSDYIRWDERNHPNTMNGWSGFEEIKTLSNHFKLNLWPAFFDYGRFWSDSWPTNNNQINDSQRQIITELEWKYPAVDFVANHYACGNYIYNSTTGEYEYGGDVVSPWEIEAGKPFVLNLDEFIVSTNRSFKWNEIEFDPITPGGGSLKKVGDKKLEYTPPQDPTIIDEFDISIIPSDWDNKPKNYVSKYKFKIKMRQVINEPILTLYENLTNNDITSNFNKLINNEIGVKYTQPMALFNTPKFTNNVENQAIKIDFNFVAPKDSTYSFKTKWDDAIRILFNGEIVFSKDEWTDTFNDIDKKVIMKKGDVLHMETYVINGVGGGNFELQINDSENNSIDWMKHSLIPNYTNVIKKGLTPLEALTYDDYQYKTRTIDKNIFSSNITSNINFSDYKIPYYDPNKYILKSEEKDINNLNEFGVPIFEIWNDEHKPGQAACSFDVEFNEPSKVGALFFGHVTNKHQDSRATNIKVTGFATDSDTNGITLYDGIYGQQFNDRGSSRSILNLDQIVVVKKLRIETYNEHNNGLLWQWFRCSEQRYYQIKSNISVNDPAFIYSDKWMFKNNDEENFSSFNNIYSISKNKGDIVKINLENINGFNIIGQANQTPTQINVYVNGQKINNSPITIKNDTIINNHCLYQYRVDNQQDMTIEIEHLDDNPFYLNYIMTF